MIFREPPDDDLCYLQDRVSAPSFDRSILWGSVSESSLPWDRRSGATFVS